MVFLGVYSAFLLEGRREAKIEERRREQIVGTLAQDCTEAEADLARASNWFEQALGQPFLDAYAEGGTPSLLPIPFPTGQGAQSWESMLAAGGVDVLEIDLIRQIDRLVNHASLLNSQAEEYNDYVRTVLVPAIDGPLSEFYGGDGRLRQKYLWYFYSLVTVRRTLQLLSEDIAACRETLAPVAGPAE